MTLSRLLSTIMALNLWLFWNFSELCLENGLGLYKGASGGQCARKSADHCSGG